MEMSLSRLSAVLLLALASAEHAEAAAKLSEAEKTAICTEAAQRFTDQTGRRVAEIEVADKVRIILMYKYLFCPVEITVKRGTMLRFVNVDKRTSHSVWFKEAGDKESERAMGGEVIEIPAAFATGPQPYLCGPHWQSDGMIGRIIVTD